MKARKVPEFCEAHEAIANNRKTPTSTFFHMSSSGTGKRRSKRTFEVSSTSNNNILRENAVTDKIMEDEKTSENAPRTQSDNDGIELASTATTGYNFTTTQRKSRFNNEPAEVQKYKRLKNDIAFLNRKLKRVGWKQLTAEEQKEYNLKTDLFNLLQSKQKAVENIKGFTLEPPVLLDSKNKKPIQKEEKASRQKLWEEQILQKAVSNKDVDEIHVEGSDKYDYVFDSDAMIGFTTDNENVFPGEEDERDGEEEAINDIENAEKGKLSLIEEARRNLPVYHYRSKLMESIKNNQVLIVVSETGSGKTTQLPQYLVEDGYTQNGKFQVAVTQPRRVAATSVATRVAEEMNVKLGQEVGYSIRFDDKTNPNKTVLKYVTDGMLLRECLDDPTLSKYSCIMIDEAHERTLATDIILGLLKGILERRDDLKVLISSATMNAEKFSKFFNDCPILKIPGRRYPVDIHYTLQPEGNYINAAITTVFQIHTTQDLTGDILLFLTGQEEIETTREKVEQIAAKLGTRIPQLIITPIYANLPQDQQSLIFQPTPANCRKLVLATNIAETSLTINGIKYVIDPGYVKENSYVPTTAMTQLLTVPCSQASVNQRAGRAGRLGPGKCFRLFTKWSFENELEMMPKPEILRTNLANTVLLLLSLGVKDLLNFPFLDKPSIPALSKSLESLYVLGALDNKGQITELGKMMCEFPCEPEFAKVLHTAATHPKCKGILQECLTIVSMLHETTSLFVGNKKAAVSSIVSEISSDHLLYLETYNEWVESGYSRAWCQDHKVQFKTMCRVRNIRNQLYSCCNKLKLTQFDQEGNNTYDAVARITCSFIAGFPMNIIKLGTSGYATLGKKTGGIVVNLHPSSVVFQNQKEHVSKPDKYILYQQLMLTSKEYVRDCLPIPQEKWLIEMVPHVFQSLIDGSKK